MEFKKYFEVGDVVEYTDGKNIYTSVVKSVEERNVGTIFFPEINGYRYVCDEFDFISDKVGLYVRIWVTGGDRWFTIINW